MVTRRLATFALSALMTIGPALADIPPPPHVVEPSPAWIVILLGFGFLFGLIFLLSKLANRNSPKKPRGGPDDAAPGL